MPSPSPTTNPLARLARRVVSFPSDATLEIVGSQPQRTGECGIGLAEQHGVPTFFCSVGSELVASANARRAAVLVLRSDEVGHPRFARVVGVLSRGPVELVDGVEVVRVELEPARVSLHRDEQDGSGTEVPLEAYLAAECPHPDFATAARQVLAHANDAHAADLRESIARANHLSTDDVVAAEITSLTSTGTEVSWIDERGAHRTRIAFPEGVTCPYGLAESLRQALDGLGGHA